MFADTPQNMTLLWALCIISLGLFVLQRTVAHLRSPRRPLPGPRSPSFFFGHLRDLFYAENADLQESWVKRYGKTFKYYGFIHTPFLYTIDSRALGHILLHSENYTKAEVVRFNLWKLMGSGLLVAEGDQHRQQRRILNPAFGSAHIRSLVPIFHQKSIELRDVLSSRIPHEGSARFDMLSWFGRAALDMIGLAGFGYSFDAMAPNKNDLNTAFEAAFRPAQPTTTLEFLQAWIPWFRLIRTRKDKQIEEMKQLLRRISRTLVHECKTAFLNSEKSQYANRKDLLSLLVKANMEEKQGMADEDLLAQIPTFVLAGHETTATAMTWALYALCTNHEVQRKLRDELFTITTDTPDMDQMKSLSYLDAVVKETLRVHPPIQTSLRIARKDDILPLEDGGSVIVREGEPLFIPIAAINRAQSIWGDDSLEFKPERWFSLPKEVNNIPSIWSHSLSFLGGPRACIGYQFAIYEMKCLLFTLIRSFEFSLAVPEESIRRRSSVITRPLVKGEEDKGYQLPLVVKLYNQR